MREIPHDHNNPAHHWISRLVEHDRMFQRPIIATQIGNNPHCCEWPYSYEVLELFNEDVDWYRSSCFSIRQEVSFIYDLDGYHNSEKQKGKRQKAVLKCPHLEPGDWIVNYPNGDGHMIVRVLNERQMLEPINNTSS